MEDNSSPDAIPATLQTEKLSASDRADQSMEDSKDEANMETDATPVLGGQGSSQDHSMRLSSPKMVNTAHDGNYFDFQLQKADNLLLQNKVKSTHSEVDVHVSTSSSTLLKSSNNTKMLNEKTSDVAKLTLSPLNH